MGLEARLDVNICVHHLRSFAIVFSGRCGRKGLGVHVLSIRSRPVR